MSHMSVSEFTVVQLRDVRRLCRVAMWHDGRLRELVRTLVEVRDVQGSLPDSINLAQGALSTGEQLHEMARRLVATLGRQVNEPADDAAVAVLVVDDLEDVRQPIVRTLLDAGFAVRTAANGVEALIAAHDWHPAVIVMDITMPVLDGIEATRLIKAVPATRDTPVIAHTGRAASLDSHAQGLFSAVVAKPCTPDQLLDAVREATRV